MAKISLADKRQEIIKIAQEHGAKNLRVFGSYIKGKSSEISDLDLLIELEPGRSLLDIIALKQDLEDILDCEVDVVTEAALSPYIREDVLKEAVGL